MKKKYYVINQNVCTAVERHRTLASVLKMRGWAPTRPGSWHSSNGKCCVGHSAPTHVEIKLNLT